MDIEDASRLTVLPFQRNASSKSSSESAASWGNSALLGGSAAVGFASVAWYSYQFGRPAQAMTPAEEGLVGIATQGNEALGTDRIRQTPRDTIPMGARKAHQDL